MGFAQGGVLVMVLIRDQCKASSVKYSVYSIQ